MCEKQSFFVTKGGHLLDGCGITQSHSTMIPMHGYNEDGVNKYEWRPPQGWSKWGDKPWGAGLVRDTINFDEKASHLNRIAAYLKAKFPDMNAWKAPEKIEIPEHFTELPELTVSEDWVLSNIKTITEELCIYGGHITAPKLESAYRLVIDGVCTFEAPQLKTIDDDLFIDAYGGSGVVELPNLVTVGDALVIGRGVVLRAPNLVNVKWVKLGVGAKLIAPKAECFNE